MPEPVQQIQARERLAGFVAARTVEAAFQPIVHLASGTVAGAESLARPTRESGFANPSELFDLAEAAGMLWEVEAVTRDAAFRACSNLPEHAQLFLNNSPGVIADPRFAGTLLRCVRETPGLTPGRVVVEITERSESTHTKGLIEQVALLKSYGFEIAIDDVGAGTSGLNRIMALRPRWLKLDRELVEEIHLDRVRQNLIRFFVHFSRLSGVRLVAEGIEHREELRTLLELGVPYAQGYHLARPARTVAALPDELSRWLRDTRGDLDAARGEDPRRARITRCARAAQIADSRWTARTALAALAKSAEAAGLVVVENERLLGWCDRRVLEEAVADGRIDAPLASLAATDLAHIEPTATVFEAVEIAAARGDRCLTTPLIVTDGTEVIGIVQTHNLLQAAAELANDLQTRTAPLTGLPGRVRADEQISALIRRAAAGAEPYDAAIIDIRGFADYNAMYGYDLGDQLLRNLVALAREALADKEAEAFIAHLGDDRFLVTAPPHSLHKRVLRLLKHFDRSVGRVEGGAEGATGEGVDASPPVLAGAVAPSLRAILLPGVFAWISVPRELWQLAESAKGAGRERHLRSGLSTLTIADAKVQRMGERLSA